MRKKRRKNKLKSIILAVILIAIAIFIYQEEQKVIVCLDAGHGGHDVRLHLYKW